jgi:hypothetical protein
VNGIEKERSDKAKDNRNKTMQELINESRLNDHEFKIVNDSQSNSKFSKQE